MCGIVGYVGKRPVVELLLKGLKRLEYRGYDSAGVAFFQNGKIEIKKSEGKLDNVAKQFKENFEPYTNSYCGIGHTRWATHGKPTTQNAHPHRTGHIVLVHNGIIENYQEIRSEILNHGHQPASETDTELFGYLVLDEMNKGLSLIDAVRKSFLSIKGSCSVVVLSEKEPGKIIGVRHGSPLVVAQDPLGGALIASDAQPIIEYNKEVVFLDHGEIVVGTEKGIDFFDLKSGKSIEKKRVSLDWSSEQLDKQGFPHYMLKEIYEQPNAFVDTLNLMIDRFTAKNPFPLAKQPGVELLYKAKELQLVACGTSYHAILLGKYWLEKWAKIPTQVDLSSEFRYRTPVIKPGTLVIGVTQSGETADTLAVIRDMKRLGVPTLGLTNVRGSTISREASAVFYTASGPEVGVAATKTFFTQMLAFLLWAGNLGFNHGAKVSHLFQKIVEYCT
ncbi:MAG: glutamine--fructose-6-phosphate transaminase (isomerizing) [Deltaproteobacteria bacterium]|nr:glutamine--fructose-6-phosphate transaminase (isomerizing) [Deltaproteobacteria bacterium]